MLPTPENTAQNLASLIETDRAGIRAACERALDAMSGPIADDTNARARVLADADLVLSDVVDSLRAGRALVAENGRRVTGDGESAAHPLDSLLFWKAFSDIVVRRLTYHADAAGDRALFTLAVSVLNGSITERLSAGLVAHSGRLLDRVHAAQADERDRIARDLHDRVGFWLDTAFRQTELFDVAKERGSDLRKAAKPVERARFALQEAMRNLRETTSDLRVQEVNNLEKALLTAFAALPVNEADLRLTINGDESWAPNTVKDEVFLIVREAVRNAIVHGRPGLLSVSVHIAPHELRVYVDDDGTGFDPEEEAGGIGLLAMQERAELLDGKLTMSTVQGRGTHVDLYVPLSERGEA